MISRSGAGLAVMTARRVLGRGWLSSRRYASSLVVAEHDNGEIRQNTLSVVTAAKEIGGPISVLVCGSAAGKAAENAAKIEGVDTVISAESPACDHAIAENVTALLEKVQGAKSFTHILFAATNEGKNIMPRLSAKLDVGCIADVLSIESEDTFTRPMYAGNAIATVKSEDAVKVISVRPTAFDKAATEGGSATVESVEDGVDTGKVSWKEDIVEKSDRPEITAADVVIAGGRGMKNGENFQMLYDLADKLGGAVGASRAAVDAGFVPNELQIGQTGKVCAPNLYIAVGISGAIQHLAGMKDSKCIVAINKDAEAPIFSVSDYGLEADLFTAVPELTEKV